MLMIFTLFGLAQASELKPPTSKNELKSYYKAIDEKAKLLKTVPDDEILREIISDCFKAKKYDENIFCLESVSEFYHYFPETVLRVVQKNFSEKDGKFIISRLDVLRSEAILGNDPSAKE